MLNIEQIPIIRQEVELFSNDINGFISSDFSKYIILKYKIELFSGLI